MQAVASSDAIGPDLSEAPENRAEGSPEMSDRRGDGFQNARLEVGNRPARSKPEGLRNAAPVTTRPLVEDKESN